MSERQGATEGTRDQGRVYHKLMHAAWWWIDRWRKSTAYTDMTAEEQGLYRNLLDEVWLRESHCIPDDPRILSRVSGDPEAWERCSEKVLRWMKLTPVGWTHVTALEVIGQSTRRAMNQRAYRNRLDNKPDNTTDNSADNNPDSPSPSPSPSPSQINRQQKRIAPPSAGAFVFPSQRAADLFLKHYPEGKPQPAMFKALRPLVEKHGWEKVGPELEAYLQGTEVSYHSWPKFASGFGSWGNGPRTAPRKNDPDALFRENRAVLGEVGVLIDQAIERRKA